MTRHHPAVRTDDPRLSVLLRVDAISDQTLDALATAWAADQDGVEAALEALAAAVGDSEDTGGTLAQVRAARDELQAVAGLPAPEVRVDPDVAMHVADEIRAAASHTARYRRPRRHLRAA